MKSTNVQPGTKYKSIFANNYTPNWFEKVFAIRRVKNTITWRYMRYYYVISTVKKLMKHSMEKSFRRQAKKN